MGISGTSGQSKEPGAPYYADNTSRAALCWAPPGQFAQQVRLTPHTSQQGGSPGSQGQHSHVSPSPSHISSGPSWVLTLCLQDLGVSKNPAHQPRGHCPGETGQETRSCSPPLPREPAGLFTHLQERGELAGPQRSAGVRVPVGKGQRVKPGRENLEGA